MISGKKKQNIFLFLRISITIYLISAMSRNIKLPQPANKFIVTRCIYLMFAERGIFPRGIICRTTKQTLPDM